MWVAIILDGGLICFLATMWYLEYRHNHAEQPLPVWDPDATAEQAIKEMEDYARTH